jgi:hypothetical protein
METKEKLRIYCPNCDEWDGVKYLSHYQSEFHFVCDYCYEPDDPDVPLQIIYFRDEIVPDHIPEPQWDKYIAKTVEIRNKSWFK